MDGSIDSRHGLMEPYIHGRPVNCRRVNQAENKKKKIEREREGKGERETDRQTDTETDR